MNESLINVNSDFKRQGARKSISYLDQAIKTNPEKTNLYFYRGLIYFYLHEFFEALLDFDYAVEKDDEPHTHYYFSRGICYACLSMFPEAVKDLTAAVTLDEECLEGFFNRGKCAYLLGDTPLSFLDF